VSASGWSVRNLLLLIGIAVTSIGLVYFATEFVDRISDWGRFLAMVLLTVLFVALGAHFESGPEAGAAAGAWPWLRATTALYVLGLVSAVVGVFVFLTMDAVDRAVKVLATLLLGLGLILVAARRYGARPPA